jgi:hypothetical protein
MVRDHDSGDVKGLEEIFRSQEFSRTVGPQPSNGAARASDDDTFFKKMFGHAHDSLTDLRRTNDAPPDAAFSQRVAPGAPANTPQTSGRRPETDSAGGGAAGDEDDVAGSPDPWKRESSRYWTIAAVSALVALVVAGVTAGNGQHAPLHGSAQGKERGVGQSHHGARVPGGSATGPTAPGALTGAIGSGALLLGLPSAATRGPGTAPGGHVTLIGAATTTGTPFPSSSTSSGGSPGGGAGGAPPGSGGSNPVAPVAAGVGSTVDAVGTSVTGLANQLGTALPAAAPTADAVNGVVNSLDQAVSATTL